MQCSPLSGSRRTDNSQADSGDVDASALELRAVASSQFATLTLMDSVPDPRQR